MTIEDIAKQYIEHNGALVPLNPGESIQLDDRETVAAFDEVQPDVESHHRMARPVVPIPALQLVLRDGAVSARPRHCRTTEPRDPAAASRGCRTRVGRDGVEESGTNGRSGHGAPGRLDSPPSSAHFDRAAKSIRRATDLAVPLGHAPLQCRRPQSSKSRWPRLNDASMS